MKNIIKFIIALLIITAALSAAVIAVSVNMNMAPEEMPEETVFRVDKGENATSIGKRLQDEGLIKNSSFFILYVKAKNTAGLMKSGLYRIKKGEKCTDIHDILLKGSEELFSVVIPPGLSSREISAILDKQDIVAAADFLAAVEKLDGEGRLYPDTYKFPRNYPAEKTVEYMIENHNHVLSEIYPDYADLSEEEYSEKIVMASIIEREYRVAEEAPMIGSVFYNRIQKNMYLGSCATVVYVITEELEKEHPEKLLFRDLDIESDYNTYRNKGLPPGPICNPGKIALDASFNPAETDYLYFLLEDPEKGTHFFSKSLSEHNKSYELYIKGK